MADEEMEAAGQRALDELASRTLEPSDEEPLVRLLAHPSKPLRLKAVAVLAEAMSAGRVPDVLCDRLLGRADADARWSAAFAASRAGLRIPQVLDIAVAALDVEDGDVRWAAASIVTQGARESDALRARLTSLASSGSPRSRKMALLCLCDCGVVDSDLYRNALRDDDPFVRLAAVTSLARSGDRSPESLEALRTVSEEDDDARVRRGAGAVLARLTNQAGGSARRMR
jgi:HEAT repeat protein